MSSPPSSPAPEFTPWPRWLPYLLGALLLVLAYYTLLNRLGGVPVPTWDESRLAVNAAEMEQHGLGVVTTFNGAPDMWNTKPPLQIWLQVLSMRVLGSYSELALRLPSALAALATAALLYLFSVRYLRHVLGATFAVAVLLTADGYVDMHVARTGDYETLLTLWQTLAALCFFWYLEQERRRALLLTAVALALGVLTKGVAGLFWLPAFLAYALLRQRLLWLLRRPEVYAAGAGAVLLIAAYYLAREHYNPGYWQAVYNNELGGRLLTTIEEHNHSWGWFLGNLYKQKFTPWLVMLPFSVLLLLGHRHRPRYQHLGLLGALVLLTHLAIISAAQTKLYWYDAPFYPIAALLVGLALGLLTEHLARAFPTRWVVGPLVILFTAALFVHPVARIIDKLNELHGLRYSEVMLQHGQQLRALARQTPQATRYTVFSSQNYAPSMQFYALAAAHNYGHQVRVQNGPDMAALQVGETVVVCGEEDHALLEQHFHTLPVQHDATCYVLLLTGRR